MDVVGVVPGTVHTAVTPPSDLTRLYGIILKTEQYLSLMCAVGVGDVLISTLKNSGARVGDDIIIGE